MGSVKRAAVFICLVLGMLVSVAAAQTWTPAGPIPRWLHSAVFDTTTNRLIVFGGGPNHANTSQPQNLNDVWRLNAATLTWTPVKPTGVPPAARIWHSAVYDHVSNRMNPSTNKMTIFGGFLTQDELTATNNVWVLSRANGL
jgi:hypothetical protein